MYADMYVPKSRTMGPVPEGTGQGPSSILLSHRKLHGTLGAIYARGREIRLAKGLEKVISSEFFLIPNFMTLSIKEGEFKLLQNKPWLRRLKLMGKKLIHTFGYN